MLDVRTILGGSVHIRRMCPFMGYNNNIAPVYCPDIYGKFISFYAATHAVGRVGSQATCWLWLWAILLVENIEAASYSYSYSYSYSITARSPCLSVSNQVVRLISIKISSSGADNIELKKGLPACPTLVPSGFAVVALLVKCRSRCHAHRNLHDCVWMDCHANTQGTHSNTLAHTHLQFAQFFVSWMSWLPSPRPFLGWQK